MDSIKATEDFFELVEELIQTGAKKNFRYYCVITDVFARRLNMNKIYITAIYGEQNGKQPNEVEFQFGWEKGDERFSSKKTIISNVEWK